MLARKRLTRHVGHLVMLASLCSLATAPATPALAEGTAAGASASGITSTRSNAVVATHKHESVHVLTAADGAVRKIQVTTALEANGYHDVADVTQLNRVEAADEEGVWHSSEGELVWHSDDGRDIVYTGTTMKALPVELAVSYTLDGQAISGSELAGRSGHLVIRYDCRNAGTTQSGRAEHTPFVAVTRVPLDSSVFSNVEVHGGTLAKHGSDDVAYGCVTTNASGDATAFEIEADVRSFALAPVTAVASSDILSALHADIWASKDATAEIAESYDEFLETFDATYDLLDETWQGLDELANRLDEADEAGSRLAGASEELSKSASILDGIGATADEVAGKAISAGDKADAMREFIQSDEAGLTAEQQEVLLAQWDELDLSGTIEEIKSGADSLSSNGADIDADAISTVSDALADADLASLSEDGRELADTLAEQLTKAVGYPGTPEDESLAHRADELKEELKQLRNVSTVPEAMAGGLANETLAQRANGTATGTTSDAKATSANPVSVIMQALGEQTDQLGVDLGSTAPVSSYTNYAGITEGTEGSVEFVFEIPSIG